VLQQQADLEAEGTSVLQANSNRPGTAPSPPPTARASVQPSQPLSTTATKTIVPQAPQAHIEISAVPAKEVSVTKQIQPAERLRTPVEPKLPETIATDANTSTGFVVDLTASTPLPHQQQPAALEKRRQRLLQAQRKREALRAQRKQEDPPTTSARMTSASSKSGPSRRAETPSSDQPAAGAKLRDNRGICHNAVKAPTCLGNGAINKEKRQKALACLDSSDLVHFVIVLRDPNNLKFRAIYGMATEDTSQLHKVYGAGPRTVTAEMAAGYFRYDSGSKVSLGGGCLLIKALNPWFGRSSNLYPRRT
jgi:hypothetical protein